jgi:hypothetical protein
MVQKAGGLRRLYSIAGLQAERSFTGSLEAGGAKYGFSYQPLKASIAGEKLLLEGRLTVTDARGNRRTRERVQALLASTQSGIGVAPVRPQVAARVGSTTEAATAAPIPVSQTESTGPLSFTGVMYFQFEPLEGRQLGVRADLSRVQLNARLIPIDSTARALQGVYSAIVDSLYGEKPDNPAAQAYVGELNRLLKG